MKGAREEKTEKEQQTLHEVDAFKTKELESHVP